MDNQFDTIMERIRSRQNEMSGSEEAKENEKAPQKAVAKQEVSSAPKVFGTSSKANDNAGVYFRPAQPKESTPKSSTSQEPDSTSENKTSTTKKPSRFSILAQEQEEFEADYTNPYNRPKEAYMRGRSPRLSVGEIRPAVLCTPAGSASIKSPNIAKASVSVPEVSLSKNGPEIALGMSDFEARRIKFAQPIVNVNYLPNESSIFSGGSSSANDMSTVLGGSAEMMNVTTSSLSCGEMSLNQHVTHENTLINAQSCDNREAILRERVDMENASIDEYGAHTFMRKKVPKEAPAAATNEPKSPPKSSAPSNIFTKPTNIHTLVSSPKPFSKDVGRAMFSPVHFTPKSTSSPKTIQPPATTTTDTVLSPSKTAALEGSVATTRRMQFEQQLRKNNNTNLSVPAPAPLPRHVVSKPAPTFVPPPPPPTSSAIQSTPHHPYTAQQKKNLFPPASTQLAAKPLVATAPIPVQTQWRGQKNTPVVQGARAEDKTAGDQLVGAGVGKLKNLKSRWEFCSATGTPIHPDATEDSLIATAMKMKESAIPKQIGHRSVYGRKGPSASSLHSQQSGVRSNTASPVSKNIRYGQDYEDEEDDDVFEEDSRPQSAENDEISAIDDIETDTSRFIDNAFGFMEGPGTGTPSPFRDASLAKEESSLSPLKNLRKRTEVIEEEDIQEISSEEDDPLDVTEIINNSAPTVPEETPVFNNKKPNDSGMAYSVSFYRKIQRERVVGDSATLTPLASVSPSAPVASLTSPQKLKQLTSTSSSSHDSPAGARIMESERETIRRISEASRIEEEQISQSQRALARARDQPSFRGSREEFEAQRALLVHVEKHRAMNVELCRLKKEGARIVDGPRGTLSIMQLSVQLDREFVKNYIEASVKPEEVFYFIAILRYADQVDVSKMVTSDNGVNRRGTLDFPTPMKLTAIPPDFRATLEIYGQRSVRESTTHEDKFKLKSTTLKAKVRPTFLGGGSTSSGNHSLFGSSSSKDKDVTSIQYYDPNATRFNLLASISFDINCRGKQTYNLPNLAYPLAAELQMKVKKEAVDGADIVFRGFLSMYQRTNEGLGSWTRYWCVLEHGEMKFWRNPEDEGHKSYLVLMDLSTCCKQEGASTVNDICPFPNSFHIDVWAPKDDANEPRGGIMQLRVMLAADTAQDLQKWLSVINSTSKQLCTWRNPIQL